VESSVRLRVRACRVYSVRGNGRGNSSARNSANARGKDFSARVFFPRPLELRASPTRQTGSSFAAWAF
jgi:hypothetical protein